MRQPGPLGRHLFATALGVAGLLLWSAGAAQAAPACAIWIVCAPASTTPPPTVTTTTVAALTSAAAPAPTPAPSPAPLPLPPVLAEVPGAATVMIGLINADRAAAGLAPLKLRDDISAFSSDHAKAMAEAGQIWHNDAFFTAATKQRFGARRVGENVASHSGLQAAHLVLMDSPGHRANLLSPIFRAVGISAWANGGTVFVAQNFIEPITDDGSAPTATPPAPGPATTATAAATTTGPVRAPTKPAGPPPTADPSPAPVVLAGPQATEPEGPQGAVEAAAGGLVPKARVQSSPAGALPTADTEGRGGGWSPLLAGTALSGAFLVAVLASLARRLRRSA